MKNKMLFYCVVLAQIAILVFIIISNLAIVNSGERVLLKTQPIDPRSLFSGDYVTLGYEISQIDLEKVPNDLGVDIKRYKDNFIKIYSSRYNAKNDEYDPNKSIREREVYVTLSKKAGDNYYTPDSITLKKPSSDRIFIKGRLSSTYCRYKDNDWNEYKKDQYGNDIIKTYEDVNAFASVIYKSIDTYYVPEGTGHQVEDQFREDRELHLVEVAVDKGGNARVVGIK